MPIKYTKTEAKNKSLLCGIEMIGDYFLGNTKTDFKCSKCGKIFKTRPNSVWQGKVLSCGHCNDPQTYY